MTIDEAVSILNSKRHQGYSGWRVVGNQDLPEFTYVGGKHSHDDYWASEAIAIAEWYITGSKEL